MTGWDARPEYKVRQQSTKLFTVKAELPEAGKTYHFKFADAQWQPSMNYGAAMDDAEIIELLIDRMTKTKNNDAFLKSMNTPYSSME